MLKHEEWRAVTIFPNCIPYEVSDQGRVRNAKTGRVLRLHTNHDGYLRAFLQVKGGKNQQVPVHRLVIEAFVAARPPFMMVDHIDGNRLNNIPVNLRWATTQLNQQNQKQSHGKTRTGVLGVSVGYGGKFQAKIKAAGVAHHLGLFATLDEAQQAYLRAKRQIHAGATGEKS